MIIQQSTYNVRKVLIHQSISNFHEYRTSVIFNEKRKVPGGNAKLGRREVREAGRSEPGRSYTTRRHRANQENRNGRRSNGGVRNRSRHGRKSRIMRTRKCTRVCLPRDAKWRGYNRYPVPRRSISPFPSFFFFLFTRSPWHPRMLWER